MSPPSRQGSPSSPSSMGKPKSPPMHWHAWRPSSRQQVTSSVAVARAGGKADGFPLPSFMRGANGQGAGDYALCDIDEKGRLLELGFDPLKSEVRAVAVQTEGLRIYGKAGELLASAPFTRSNSGDSNLDDNTPSPAAQVLRLVVGLLGLEVHEKPSSWSEVWLQFQSNASLGVGGSKEDLNEEVTEHRHEMQSWQAQVLENLRNHIVKASTARSTSNKYAPGAHVQSSKHDWGPDFEEHLDLAEFVMKRIAHAVGILQDPAQDSHELVLREYTEKMVMEVCSDLRQWLDQLATLISLYHVHLLDLEEEKRRLAETLDKKQAMFDESEKKRKEAETRYQQIKASREEEKMKQRAEALLGIQLHDENALIYSQKDMDDEKARWEEEELEPLLMEIKELKASRDEAWERLEGKGKDRRPTQKPVQQNLEGLTKAASQTLAMGLNAVGERITDEMLSSKVMLLAKSVQSNGRGLEDLVKEISALPLDKPPQDVLPEVDEELEIGAPGTRPSTGVDCLDVIITELSKLAAGLDGIGPTSGVQSVASFVTWSHDSVKQAKEAMQNKKGATLVIKPCPRWNLNALQKNDSKIAMVQTGAELMGSGGGDAEAIRASLEKEYAGRLARLKDSLSGKIEAAEAEAERQKARADELMALMEEEARKAEQTLKELRKRLLEMERLLKAKGLHSEASDAIFASGLGDFLQGQGDVFERLYRDAMDRMRRFAEAQTRHMKDMSQDFLTNMRSVLTEPMQILEREDPVGRNLIMSQRDTTSYKFDFGHDRPRPGLGANTGPAAHFRSSSPEPESEPLQVKQLLRQRQLITTEDEPPGEASVESLQQYYPQVPVVKEVKVTKAVHGPGDVSNVGAPHGPGDISSIVGVNLMQSSRTAGAPLVAKRSGAKPSAPARWHGTEEPAELPPLPLELNGQQMSTGSPGHSPGRSKGHSPGRAATKIGSPRRGQVSASQSAARLDAMRYPGRDSPLLINRILGQGPAGDVISHEPAGAQATRTAKPKAAGSLVVGRQMLRQGGTSSMPQLNGAMTTGRPPRLLMQSVGSL